MLGKVIKVDPEDSLNVVLSYVQAEKDNRIILKIPESNDLLTSLVGLKTLHSKFLDLKKQVVLLVPDKKFVDLAEKAGLVATTSLDEITVNVWNKLKKEVVEHELKSVKPVALTKHPQFDKTASKVVVGNSDLKQAKLEEQKVGLTGMDVAQLVKHTRAKANNKIGRLGKAKEDRSTIKTDVKEYKEFTSQKRKKVVKNTLKLIGFTILFLLAFFAIIAYLFYKYVPRVYITLDIKKTPVTLNTQISASLAVTGFDVEKKQIPLIKEEVKKQGSTTIKAKEEVTEGTYATGTVRINNPTANAVTVPAGTELVSDNNLKFKTTQEITIQPGNSADVSVQAVEYGEDYNLDAGHTFDITGFPGLSASNISAFSGGSKDTYIVVGKKEVEDGVKDLKKSLFEEAKTELEELNKDKGYEFIPESIKNDLDGDYKVDPAIGTKAEDAYLEVKTKSSALYYHKDSLEELVSQLMLMAYRKKMQIGNDALLEIKNLEIKVNKITVSKNRDNVVLDISAKGEVIPKVDTEVLKQAIAGKDWNEATKYLKELPYLKSEPVVRFDPKWIPERFWYMPSETNRISIIVQR